MDPSNAVCTLDKKMAAKSEVIYMNDSTTVAGCTRRWYRKCLTWGTAIDFILFTTYIVVLTVAVERGYIPHPKRGFYCGDPSLSHRYRGDTVSNTLLSATSLFAPIVIMTMVEKLRSGHGATLSKMWLWYVGYVISTSSFGVISQLLKVSTGTLRPHFFHTCAPDAALNCTVGDYIAQFKCLNTGRFTRFIVSDSSLSFPSGHAGVAMMTSIFCAVYMHKRLEARSLGVLMKPFLISAVLTWGPLVTVSRVQDNRHHWLDVLVANLIGVVFMAYSIVYHCDSFKVSAKHKNKKNSIIKLPNAMSEKAPMTTSGQID